MKREMMVRVETMKARMRVRLLASLFLVSFFLTVTALSTNKPIMIKLLKARMIKKMKKNNPMEEVRRIILAWKEKIKMVKMKLKMKQFSKRLQMSLVLLIL
jgi:hypothetical protein